MFSMEGLYTISALITTQNGDGSENSANASGKGEMRGKRDAKFQREPSPKLEHLSVHEKSILCELSHGGGGWLQGWFLFLFVEPLLNASHVGVDDRSQIESHQLGEQETADHDQPERL